MCLNGKPNWIAESIDSIEYNWIQRGPIWPPLLALIVSRRLEKKNEVVKEQVNPISIQMNELLIINE